MKKTRFKNCDLPKCPFHSGYWVHFLSGISHNFICWDFNFFQKIGSFEMFRCIDLQKGGFGVKTTSSAVLDKAKNLSKRINFLPGFAEGRLFNSSYQVNTFRNIMYPWTVSQFKTDPFHNIHPRIITLLVWTNNSLYLSVYIYQRTVLAKMVAKIKILRLIYLK